MCPRFSTLGGLAPTRPIILVNARSIHIAIGRFEDGAVVRKF